MDRLAFRIGGLSIRLRSANLELDSLRRRYQPFVTDDTGEVDLVVDVQRAEHSEPAHTDAAQLAKAAGYLQDNALGRPGRDATNRLQMEVLSRFLSSPGVQQCLDDFDPVAGPWTSLGVGKSNVWFIDGDKTRVQAFVNGEPGSSLGRALDGYLYALLHTVLIARRSLLLHAAGIARDGEGFVFVGPSGSGKTTIATRAGERGWAVLADDGIVAARAPDGRVRAYGTPWSMQAPPWNGSFGRMAESAEVKSLFFIEHGPVEARRRLGGLAAATRIVANNLGMLQRLTRQEARRAFEMAVQLANSIPCYELSFTPSCSFLSEIV